MSFDEVLKLYKTKTCIMSVEKLGEGRFGNIRVAVGISYSKDEPDILKAMRNADQKMYEDKKRFYSENPDLVYRK